MAEYANTVLACAGVLTIKQAAVVLWTVRARIMSGTINFKEEANNLFGPAFSVVLTSIPGTGTKETVEISERITLNNATNEPLFLALALAGGTLAATSPPAVLVKTFMWARCGHNLSYLMMPYIGAATPRTACYSTGLVASLIMAGIVLKRK